MLAHMHPGAQFGKELALPMQRFRRFGFSPGSEEDALEKKAIAHSSILAGKLYGHGSLVGVKSMESQRVRHDLATKQHFWNRATIEVSQQQMV